MPKAAAKKAFPVRDPENVVPIRKPARPSQVDLPPLIKPAELNNIRSLVEARAQAAKALANWRSGNTSTLVTGYRLGCVVTNSKSLYYRRFDENIHQIFLAIRRSGL